VQLLETVRRAYHHAGDALALLEQFDDPLAEAQLRAGLFRGVLQPWVEGRASHAVGSALRRRIRDQPRTVERVAKARARRRHRTHAGADADAIQHLHACRLHEMRGHRVVTAALARLQHQDPQPLSPEDVGQRGTCAARADDDYVPVFSHCRVPSPRPSSRLMDSG
jgi:hypothetical protein